MHVVVGVADDLRLDERVGRQLAVVRRPRRTGRSRRSVVANRRVDAGRGSGRSASSATAGRSRPARSGRAPRAGRIASRRVLCTGKFPYGRVDDQAGGGPGVEERAVGERLRGHLREPVVEGREPARQRGEDWHLLGRVAGHDLAVLVIGRLAAHLGGERADVVGHEPVHRRAPGRGRPARCKARSSARPARRGCWADRCGRTTGC